MSTHLREAWARRIGAVHNDVPILGTTVTLYHGTNQAALDAIKSSGSFEASDMERVATEVEQRYGLSRGSVWNSPFNSFSRSFRSGDRKVYFSGDRATSIEYARIGSEAVFDAVGAAWWLLNPTRAEESGGTALADQQAWVRSETAKHYQPVLVTLEVPASFVAERGGFGDVERFLSNWEQHGASTYTTISLAAPIPASYITSVERV
jgi:hypothetical protein